MYFSDPMLKYLYLFLLLNSHLHSQEETCDALYTKIKSSDCGKRVFQYLEGAELKVGLAIHASGLSIKSDNNSLSEQEGLFHPSPQISLSLPPSYIWISDFGYEFSFGYANLFGHKQRITRDNKVESYDLSTYFSTTMVYLTPTLFYALGGQDDTPTKYLKVGLGYGLGYSWNRGTSYYTEKYGTECYDQATQVLNGQASTSSLGDKCDLKAYAHHGFGGSARIIIDMRYYSVSLSIGLDFVNLARDEGEELSPAGINVAFLYWIAI